VVVETALYPIDTIKTRLQVIFLFFFCTIAAFLYIASSENKSCDVLWHIKKILYKCACKVHWIIFHPCSN
jgi:hypothetical protein